MAIESFDEFIKVVKHGSVISQYNIGICYYLGIGGVEQNKEEAFKWFKNAAEQGYTNAQYLVGKFYEQGIGVKQNKKKAFKWYTKAAKQRNVEAMYMVGKCYDNGDGVKQNKEEALKWYKKIRKAKLIFN